MVPIGSSCLEIFYKLIIQDGHDSKYFKPGTNFLDQLQSFMHTPIRSNKHIWLWFPNPIPCFLFLDVAVRLVAIYPDLFPTCQVRVVRFYVSCLLLLFSPRLLLLLLLNRRLLLAVQIPVGTAGPPLRAPDPCRTSTTTITASVPCRTSTTTITASVPCRTSTTTIPAQCSLPDLNHDHPRPVFPAGPQPRVSPPSVPCRTSTWPSTPSVPCRTSTASIHAKRYAT